MKTKFGEEVKFNAGLDTVTYDTLAETYPLPSQYTEVNYIQNSNKINSIVGRIVLDDFNLSDFAQGDTLRINFNMMKTNAATNAFVWFGGGRFSAASNGQSYAVSLFNYTATLGDDTTTYKFNICMPGAHWAQNACVTTNIPCTPGNLYDMDFFVTRGATYATWGGRIMDVNTGLIPYEKKTYTGGAVTNFGYNIKLCIFDMVMLDYTYPQYYAWGYNARATSTGPATGSSYAKVGLRFYSRGKIFKNNTPYMYLYTCYKNDTHQYGIYDAVKGHFYADFAETLNNTFVNNPNYYWSNIISASGNTIAAKEKTFLNIYGPGE